VISFKQLSQIQKSKLLKTANKVNHRKKVVANRIVAKRTVPFVSSPDSSDNRQKTNKKQQKPTHPKPGAKKLLIKQTKPPNKDNHRKQGTANRTVPVAFPLPKNDLNLIFHETARDI